MIDMFAMQHNRFESFSIQFDDILFDYSKNILDRTTITLLIQLANASNLKSKIFDLFTGRKINTTEKRAVLHTALRSDLGYDLVIDNQNIASDVRRVLDKMESFVERVHSGEYTGSTGKKITDVVNIGIGGSDLGPAMVTQALDYYRVDGIKTHFVSNVDATDIIQTTKFLDPETTLFIITSKTFTTQETMINAEFARK